VSWIVGWLSVVAHELGHKLGLDHGALDEVLASGERHLPSGLWRLAGDVNEDGVVDFADFVVLSNNYGKTDSTWARGDLNGDGVTQFDDFLLLSEGFGKQLLTGQSARSSRAIRADAVDVILSFDPQPGTKKT